MTLSVVIPTWSATPELANMALKLCKQVRNQCDELIVSEDGFYIKEIQEIADKYLLHPRLGHAKNLAEGIKVTTSEFVAVMDSDMEIVSGTLRDLCIAGYVVSPKSVQYRVTDIARWFIVCPREFLITFLPYEQPTQAVPDGIDVWGRDFNALYEKQLISSDKLIVNHHVHGGSYDVYWKQKDK